MPVCTETNSAMQELTGVKYNLSVQNKDMTTALHKRDMKDTIAVLETLADGKNPFTQERLLKNIMTFQDGMKVTAKKDALLANTENKKRFTAMLRRHLSESGCRTLHTEGDADVLIVKAVVDSAVTHPTVFVGDDTDLLVLLCYHTKADGNDFRPETKANSSRVWNMLKVKVELGPEVCRNMLFLQFEDWGWKLSGNQVIPVTTDLPAAVAWKENAVSPGQINFPIKPDQINFAVRPGDGNFFFVFFLLVTSNEENIMLNCPKSIGRSEMN